MRDAQVGATFIGLEHEYRVMDGRHQVDFLKLVHGLGLGTPGLDPGDPNAYRLPSGNVVTRDGDEAEIAHFPVELSPRFTRRVVENAAAERLALEARLPNGLRLEGVSTHLSVRVAADVDINEWVANFYTRTFGVGLMLLMDGCGSPGLLVRPRPTRLELCGEFVEGDRLRATLAYAAGSVLACLRVFAGERPAMTIPTIALRVEPARARYGWYVDRCAAGTDLYAEGRGAPLPLEGGGATTGQEHLERCWMAARAELAGRVAGDDLDAADAMVSGRRTLPCEGPAATAAVPRRPARMRSAHGALLRPRRRSGFEVAPVVTIWDVSVFLVVDRWRTRRAFASVPQETLAPFLRALDRGRLDAVLAGYLRCAPEGRTLGSHALAATPGLYDELGNRSALTAPERPPEG